MANVTYHLRARDEESIQAWEKFFGHIPEVKPSLGDILEFPADAIVSPANSFGFMDGGIDRLYSEYFGWHVQDRLRALLRDDYDGELPIGLAVIIETDHPDIP
jgi:O-acetyl-ADP-ribose deacetylase (regulator of RNase III)